MSHAHAFIVICLSLCAISTRAVDAPSPADVDKVNQLVTQWAAAPESDRDAGEIALQRQLPSRLFPLLEAAITDRKDLSDDARAWLKSVVDRERPWEAARLKLAAQAVPHNEWNLRTALESYDKAGHKDPKWDASAREGLRAFFAPRGDRRKALVPLATAVDQQGCDDPLVTYAYARALEAIGANADPGRINRLYQSAADAIVKTDYPATRKELAVLRCFEYRFDLEKGRFQSGWPLPADFKAWLNATTKSFMDLFPEVCAEPGVPEDILREIALRIVDLDLKQGMDRKPFFDWIEGPLTKALPPTSAAPLTVKGEFYIKYAWDGRGRDWAANVTPEGWKLFRERLAEADAALEAAWKLDPTRPEIADEMMVVALGSNWPRAKMELWFNRAMALNPDDEQACINKLYYLEPKWHGSPEAMLDFGHECLNNRNWAGNIPMMLLTAHRNLSKYAQDENDYWRIPAVWDDLLALYTPLLKAEPGNTIARSHFCYWACRCQRWDEAARQFKLLGDNADPTPFGGKPALARFRAQAAAN